MENADMILGESIQKVYLADARESLIESLSSRGGCCCFKDANRPLALQLIDSTQALLTAKKACEESVRSGVHSVVRKMTQLEEPAKLMLRASGALDNGDTRQAHRLLEVCDVSQMAVDSSLDVQEALAGCGEKVMGVSLAVQDCLRACERAVKPSPLAKEIDHLVMQINSEADMQKARTSKLSGDLEALRDAAQEAIWTALRCSQKTNKRDMAVEVARLQLCELISKAIGIARGMTSSAKRNRFESITESTTMSFKW